MTLNLAAINKAVSKAVSSRDAIVFRDRRLSYQELFDRNCRLANFLLANDIGIKRAREELQTWESGQDHVGLYLYNGNEYLEGMFGAFHARAVPFNVNYRYVDEELVYLLNDAKAKALIYHSSLSDRIEAIRERVPTLKVFLQVQDSDDPLIDGAIDYERALADSTNDDPAQDLSADDLYMLYTGGTTGMPKGVLWRQEDILIAALGGRRANGIVLQSVEEFVARAQTKDQRSLPAPPFMHGAGSWNALQTLNSGGTVVIQNNVNKFDPADVVATIERENVSILLIVGDAFGRPLADELSRQPRALPTLRNIVTGGAITTATVKEDLIARLPNVNIIDSAGSSETGGQGSHRSNAKTGISSGQFNLSENNAVLSEDLSTELEPGHEGIGWWARSGNIPLGYLDDEAKTKKTFAVVNGTRYSIPGDRVRLLADGALELHGRDSVTINSGGEKIFAEEVEQAIKHHPSVFDAVVAGRKSERWGNEVVAIVQMRDGIQPNAESILETCQQHIARYKLPKDFVFVDELFRSPNGKADYKWAKQIADPT